MRLTQAPKPAVVIIAAVTIALASAAAATWHRRGRALVRAFLLAALWPSAAFADDPPAVERFYDTVKEQEEILGAPEFRGHGVVGTFDAATGEFAGLRTHDQCFPGDPKPICGPMAPSLEVNGVRAVLVFRIEDARVGDEVTLTVNNRVRTRTDAPKRMAVDIGRATHATWNLRSAHGAAVRDRVNIERPELLGAGAFTLKAVPYAVIYTPPEPADPTRTNRASYAQATTIGTRVSTAIIREHSTTRPKDYLEYKSAEDLQVGLKAAALGLSRAGPKGQVAAGALRAVSKALGSAQRIEQSVKSTVDGTAMEVQATNSSLDMPTEAGGPGVSDLVCYLENAHLVWLYRNGQMSVALLGQEAAGCKNVSTLRTSLRRLQRDRRRGKPATRMCLGDGVARASAQPAEDLRRCRTGLDIPSLEALLRLDPMFAGGPQARLRSERFARASTDLILDNALKVITVERTVTRDDTRAVEEMRVTTTDTTKGFLSFADIGPSATEHVVSTVAASSATSFRQSKTVRARAVLEGPPPGSDRFRVYFDRLFGTFVFQAQLP